MIVREIFATVKFMFFFFFIDYRSIHLVKNVPQHNIFKIVEKQSLFKAAALLASTLSNY